MKLNLLAAAMLLWPHAGLAEEAIRVSAPWARATILISRPGVAYLTLHSLNDDRLIGAETPVANAVMIHAADKTDGVSRMTPLTVLDLPAGHGVTLRTGGTHLMLMGLKAKLVEGGSFPLTLQFEHAGAVTVKVPVLGIAAQGPGVGE